MNHILSTLSRLLMVVFLLAAWLAMPSGTAKASAGAIFTANSTSDADAVDGVCSLREAIKAATLDLMSYNDCTNSGTGFGVDLIVFSISSSTTITLGADLREIDFNSTLTIDGSNSGSPVVIDGANAHRPFLVSHGSSLTL